MEDLKKEFLKIFDKADLQTKIAITLNCLVINMTQIKNILDELQENQKKFSLILKQHEESIQKLEKKSL